MSDLTEFLAARLDETKRAAELAAQITDWTDFALGLKCEGVNADVASPLVHQQSPSRVLRAVESGRKILEMHQDCGDGTGICDDGGHADEDGCGTLALYAERWSDHPEFDQDWLM